MEHSRAAIVTGAASGIGLETANLFLIKGFSVVLVDRELHRVSAAIDGLQASGQAIKDGFALPLAKDLATAQGCAECIVEALELLGGRLDVLVNCAALDKHYGIMTGQYAGGFRLSAVEDTSPELWQWLFDINFHAVVRLSSAAKPHLEKTRGCIVSVSSISAQRPAPGLGAYCSAKAAQDMFTKSAALEWAPKGIRVNSVNPSTIKTDLHRSAGIENLDSFFAEDVASHPLGRIGTPADVAAICVFLADPDQSGWVTGQHIVVDGGRLLPAPTATMQ